MAERQVFQIPGSGEFVAELLPNGLVRVDSRASGSVGCWERVGMIPAHGDLTRSIDADDIRRKLCRLFPWQADKQAWNSRI